MKTAISRREAARLCVAAACGAALLRHRAAFGQVPPAPASAPQIDVSTVKPSNFDPSNYSSGINTGHGRLDGQNVTLQRCIIGAYGVGPNQVVGSPDWVYSDRWDIMAKVDQPIDDDAILNQMLQALLGDRFKLALHRDKKVLPAYVLEVDKKGPKMEKADGGDSVTNTNTGRAGGVTITASNTDMDLLAQMLARKMDLPVVDQTGLAGVFNFTLHWTPDTVRPPEARDDDVSIFAALPEQLGLRLRSAKVPVDVLVIDHAEMPTAN